MPRIVVVGGSGHVGSYRVPALAERGHEVVNVSRGIAKPYRPRYTSLEAVYESVQALVASGAVSVP